MPRRKSVNLKRDIGVDIRFKSPIIQKLINMIMERGKKAVAQSIVYDALGIIAQKHGGSDEKARAIFEKAVTLVRPGVEVKSRRVGGGVYQIPIEVRPSRALALSLRWIINAAKSRNDKTMGERLAKELLDAIEGHGTAVKKKSDVHRMAEANRAFSHYAW
jgi:small subunit ribosomal protein S7